MSAARTDGKKETKNLKRHEMEWNEEKRNEAVVDER